MNRPYIFCHMVTSIDGKIDGPHRYAHIKLNEQLKQKRFSSDK